jgi:hypothetical protein
MKAYSILSKILAVFYFIFGAGSISGGIQLITTNGMGMSLSMLDNTPFNSFLVPGLILAIVIGGLSLLTSVLLFFQYRLAIECTAALGFGLIIWIYVEMYLTHMSFWLQTVIFSIGVIIIISSMILYKLSIRNTKQLKNKPSN